MSNKSTLVTREPYCLTYHICNDCEADESKKYQAAETMRYFSKRYQKFVTVHTGMWSDGATGAFDVRSFAWWVHDVLCNTGQWDDRTPCTNWQASSVLYDILKEEGFWIRDFWWRWTTFLLGGGKARENGMWTLDTPDRRRSKSFQDYMEARMMALTLLVVLLLSVAVMAVNYLYL